MGIGLKLQALLQEKNKKPGTLASETGISKNTIYAIIKRDNSKVDMSILEAIAKNLGVSIDRFFEQENPSPFSRASLLPVEARRVPLLGPVAAGEPIMAEPEYDEFVAVAGEGNKADAALRVEGDSMAPRYLDRDIVFIRIQDDVEDGEVAAVQIDDNVTLKHVYHIPGGVQLISDNPAYKPMTYTAENADCIRIIGKAIGFQRWEK